MQKLLALQVVSLAELDEDIILVSHDLMPSEALDMDKNHVKGIVLEMGSPTSHTAILARAFGIPAVLGLQDACREVIRDETIAINGSNGELIIKPDDAVRARYERAMEKYRSSVRELHSFSQVKAETRDGRRVSIMANIETPEEADLALADGAEGIGLYRSEFLFLSPGVAMEEERQYQAYSKVLKTMGDKPVTIRTIDVGGDKASPNIYRGMEEKNPLLGWRAIRICLALPELFKTQLRAILRASVYGNVRIMFPMIAEIEELENTLALLEEAKEECRAKKQPFKDDIRTGIMIEVPAAAVMAGSLAEKSGFFSIGTNDLLQYSFAVDRGNEKVGYLARVLNPALLHLVKGTIEAAHAKGIEAAMCGEMAGDPRATAILLGLGLDSFSMSAQSIPLIKKIIRGFSLEGPNGCKNLAKNALENTHYAENAALVDAWMAKNAPKL
jgi:phosphotransferase system enzyme I (PtsI)